MYSLSWVVNNNYFHNHVLWMLLNRLIFPVYIKFLSFILYLPVISSETPSIRLSILLWSNKMQVSSPYGSIKIFVPVSSRFCLVFDYISYQWCFLILLLTTLTSLIIILSQVWIYPLNELFSKMLKVKQANFQFKRQF